MTSIAFSHVKYVKCLQSDVYPAGPETISPESIYRVTAVEREGYVVNNNFDRSGWYEANRFIPCNSDGTPLACCPNCGAPVDGVNDGKQYTAPSVKCPICDNTLVVWPGDCDANTVLTMVTDNLARHILSLRSEPPALIYPDPDDGYRAGFAAGLRMAAALQIEDARLGDIHSRVGGGSMFHDWQTRPGGEFFDLLSLRFWDVNGAKTLLKNTPRLGIMVDVEPHATLLANNDDDNWLPGIVTGPADPSCPVDLSVPIILISLLNNRGTVNNPCIDGWKRIALAHQTGVTKLPAVILTLDETQEIETRQQQTEPEEDEDE